MAAAGTCKRVGQLLGAKSLIGFGGFVTPKASSAILPLIKPIYRRHISHSSDYDHFSRSQHETEKLQDSELSNDTEKMSNELRNDMEKMRNAMRQMFDELRYEMEKSRNDIDKAKYDSTAKSNDV